MYVFELIGEDDAFAAYEASCVVGSVDVIATGIAAAIEAPERVEHLAWTRTICEEVCRTEPHQGAMVDGLAAVEFDREGSIAVRARGVRETSIDTERLERSLGGVLTDHGFSVNLDDPDHSLRVLVSDELAVLGWVCREPGGDVGRRRPIDRPFFQPGSMSPRLARWIVNVAGTRPDSRVLDPMCGTGGLVLECARVGGSCCAMDIQHKMVRGTRENWRAIEPSQTPTVLLGDAGRLPFVENAFDAVIFDAPYGRQSKIAGHDVVGRALEEAKRVAHAAVVVWDRPVATLAHEAGWSVDQTFQRHVHRSLTRHICHLS